MNYYNENNPHAAAWLRELIAAGLLPDGIVDERSIEEVEPEGLEEFTQCHFFAGISGWSLALALAGWPSTRPVWTGSCPCQPFSVAGKGGGIEDKRDLWPEFGRLIATRAPTVIFGEQVAAKAGREWLLRVRLDVEGMGYAVGAADLCSPCVGAPHIRQRLFWLAESRSQRRERRQGSAQGREHDGPDAGRVESHDGLVSVHEAGCIRMGDSPSPRPLSSAHAGVHRGEESRRARDGQPERSSSTGRLGNASPPGLPASESEIVLGTRRRVEGRAIIQPGSALGFWDAFDAIYCLDGKTRRIEPGTFPLAHGVPGRVGKLRAYGNAIVPQVAAEFIKAYMAYEAYKEF